jgi:membrane protein YdbS with pleckstrin-like domain
MAKLDRYLLRSEDQVFSVRRHWVSLASAAGRLALFWFGGLLVLWLVNSVALLRGLLVAFFIGTLAWFAWVFTDWYVERFVVTNKRVLLVSGIITRKVAIMPLVKVTDLTYEQTGFGRLLDYGSFIIESAGQQQALSRIDYLPDPNLRYHQVSELLFGRYAVQSQDDGTGGLWPIAPATPSKPSGYDAESSRTTSPLPWIPPDS